MDTHRRPAREALVRRGRLFLTFLATFAVLWMLLPGNAAPAYAAGGTLNLTLESVDPSVQSGQGASFRIQWSCSGAGSCDNGRIEVPVPAAQADSDAFPDGIPLSVTSQSGVSGGTASIEGTAPNQVLVWNLPDVVSTGASGTLTFTLLPPNSVTPDGATITPIGTFTADGATTVTANEDGEEQTVVESSVSLKTVKTRTFPTDVPYVDQQVTYRLLVGYESQFGTSTTQYAKRMRDVCEAPGVQALENLRLVDTLEPGAEFVSATLGGIYDAGSHTVVWDLGSSISDTAPYGCRLTGGHVEWNAPEVTVRYPSPDFEADPSTTAVTNSVVVTANPWGQPDVPLTSDSSTSHGLREGTPGASVGKGPGYDWAIGAPLYRGIPTAHGTIYNLHGSSTDTRPARWQFTDMMPCALTSPTNADDTDCAEPAFIDLNFSTDRYLAEIELAWTTNAGTTGVCILPAGTSMNDYTKRYCAGSTSSEPAPGVPAGEWITKIEVDTDIPAFGGGRVYIHGTPHPDLTTDNVDTEYVNPDLDVERTDEHPNYVTVENCPITNTITFESGQVWNPAQPQLRSDNGGICGYRQVMTEPVSLRPIKTMYDPALPGTPPAVPAVQPGGSLTVDLAIRRSNMGPSSLYGEWTFTPTVTEYLPTNLVFDPDSLQVLPQTNNTPSNDLVTRLGEPEVDISTVTVGGEQRQKVTITFPDADIDPGMQLGSPGALVRFEVQVKDGVPAGTYTNDYLLTAAEAGPDISETYLLCPTGTMVDVDLNPTTDRSAAIGCLATASYTVLPTPGASIEKTVQGAYDEERVAAPGIGATSIGGEAEYALDVRNSGSVDIRNVVVYDILPRIDDTLTLPGAAGEPRDSEFPVTLTGPITTPAGATVQYSTSENPCRGDLAGTGGGAIDSAPADCDDDWSVAPPAADYSQVTAIRVDFGSREFASGESEQIILNVQTTATEGALDGVAWNNAAIVAREASSDRSTLPIEQTPVGLQMLPDLTWSKTDQATNDVLGGSEWSLDVADGNDATGFPMGIVDCTEAPCDGPDQDPAVGEFRLNGVPWGEYLLTEVTAPDGYVLLEDPIEVSMTSDGIDEDALAIDLGGIQNRLQQGDWSLSKTSDPASGSVVAPGDTITYTLTAANDSEFPARNVVVTDDLGDVLDDAEFGEFVDDDGGNAVRDGDMITWNAGTLAAGETRTVSYAVTVNDDAKGITLRNVVTGEGDVPPTECSVEDPCETTHETPAEWSLSKTSDPASGSVVAPGDTITYTLTAENSSKGAVDDVVVTDDLGDVLDDAEFGEFVDDDGGNAVRDGNMITWNVGTLAAGETRTVSYVVSVNDDAKGVTLRNVATGEGEQPPTECTVEDPCETTHETPAEWSLSKTSDPASGSEVKPGDTVTYTLTAVNASAEAVDAVVVTDDLSDVLSSAEFGEFVDDDGGNAVRDGNTITWNVGTLAAGETRTVSYAVTVNDDANGITLRNVVTGEGDVPPNDCTVEDPCETTHETPKPPVGSDNSGDDGSLAVTGGTVLLPLGAFGLVLLLAGAVALVRSRHLKRDSAGRTV
ncbi:isopeptide-forming domain-containing fimbrial protein [Microbacterium halotolerans]|uniref:DUF7927 domain-containing protein n=1 Tax=Microbacterium halotolerans TaxID=246613 RepID=UPI0013C33FAB|nr:isopeptide-forming domain-containing fimbrial protein [Microbacterium halotolerans]